MINVDALIALIKGGDPETVNLEANVDSSDPYERVFGLRNALVEAHRYDPPSVTKAFEALLDDLRVEFGELPEREDRERVQQIVAGVILNPREIDDLNESELYASHDVLLNVGVMRTILYSYGILLGEEADDSLLVDWMAHYSFYMVV